MHCFSCTACQDKPRGPLRGCHRLCKACLSQLRLGGTATAPPTVRYPADTPSTQGGLPSLDTTTEFRPPTVKHMCTSLGATPCWPNTGPFTSWLQVLLLLLLLLLLSSNKQAANQ